MIKTIIFDFDGTIADTLPLIFEFYNKNAKSFGFKNLSRDEVEALRNKSALEIFKEFNISLVKLPFLAKKIRDDLYQNIEKVRLFPGVKDVLLKINKRGFNLGILSSNSKENIEKFLQANKLTVFRFIHSESNIFGKTNALKNLLENHKLNPKEVVYIGDEVRDIEACKNNGVKIAVVTWGFNKREILIKNRPDFLLDKPEEILHAIEIDKIP